MAKTASKIGKNPLDFLRPDGPRTMSLGTLVQPPPPPAHDPEVDRLASELTAARGELEGVRTSLAGARAEILVRLDETARATRALADLQASQAELEARARRSEEAMGELRAQQARALKGAGLQGMVAGFFVTLLIMAAVTMLMG